MYAFLWRVMPGPWWARAAIVAVLLVVFLYVLFEWVYPWLAPLLPFQQQTVTEELS